MGFDEKTTRQGVISSCQDLLRFQAMFARHFALAPVRQFGARGEAAIRQGLDRYGRYRGGLIKAALAQAGLPLTARTLLAHWDMADVHLLSETGGGEMAGSDRRVRVTIADGPD